MIQAFRYEPHGQRQRFEPRERHDYEGEQRHIHLHLHLHLGARRAHARRFWQPTGARVTTLFAAFIGALSMALSFIFLPGSPFSFDGPPIAPLAGALMLIGALLGLGAVLLGGLPLAISAWRSNPRSRLLLLTPVLAILTPFILAGFLGAFGFINLPLLLAELLIVAALWRPAWRERVFWALLSLLLLTMPLASLVLDGLRQTLLGPGSNGDAALVLLLYVLPLLTTIAIVRAIRRVKPTEHWLRLLRSTRIPSVLVMGGMLVMLAGLLLWGGTVLFFQPGVFPHLLALLTLPFHSWLLELIGMVIALVVALFALFSDTPSRAQARPKDASLADVASSRERGYYPLDLNRE